MMECAKLKTNLFESLARPMSLRERVRETEEREGKEGRKEEERGGERGGREGRKAGYLRKLMLIALICLPLVLHDYGSL